MLHSPSWTWNLKMMVSKRNLLFQGTIFRFHVRVLYWRVCFSRNWCHVSNSEAMFPSPQAPPFRRGNVLMTSGSRVFFCHGGKHFWKHTRLKLASMGETWEEKTKNVFFCFCFLKVYLLFFLQFPNGEDSWKQYWYTYTVFILNMILQFVRYQSLFETSNPYSQPNSP